LVHILSRSATKSWKHVKEAIWMWRGWNFYYFFVAKIIGKVVHLAIKEHKPKETNSNTSDTHLLCHSSSSSPVLFAASCTFYNKLAYFLCLCTFCNEQFGMSLLMCGVLSLEGLPAYQARCSSCEKSNQGYCGAWV